MDPKQSIASALEVDTIVSEDVDTPVEETRGAVLYETDLVSWTPSYRTPVHSCVAGCNSEKCEQLIQDGDGASPSLVSP